VAVLAVAGLLAALGCGGGTDDASAPADERQGASATESGPPSADELAAATYQGLDGIDGPVTLVEGRWEGEPYVEGAAARPAAMLLDLPALSLDLDSDGAAEAVAFLASSTGGSGARLHLAVVGRGQGGLVNTATAQVGDRVQIRAARVEGDQVVLDVVQAGEGDAMCCPGDLATRTWRLEGGRLAEVRTEFSGRLGTEVMAGPEWVLEAWAPGEPAPEDPEVTLVITDGVLAGSSGCNRYTTKVTTGDGPGEITLGPVAGTRMMCPPEQMEVEDRFLAAFANVTRFGFWNGRLALTATSDQGVTTLLFAAREPALDGGGGE
jgi:putative lipoprotein